MRWNASAVQSVSFVLGIPRSGTTWLANILDSLPSTALFLEPFSTIASDAFPKIPPTSLFLNSREPQLETYFESDFLPTLARYKTLLPGSDCRTGRFKMERRLARLIRFGHRYGKIGMPKRCRLFELLNLNRMASDCPLFEKERVASHWVVKELRAAGKTGSLQSAFPNSKFVVIIRHPCATVDSILKWFDKGRLGEIRSELTYFNASLRSQSLGEKYSGLIGQVESTASLASQVALYWRVHYEVMLDNLRGHANCIVIPHEQLASEPLTTVRKVVDFFQVNWSSQVETYMNYSMMASSDAGNPVSTRRKPGSYKDWCQKIDPDIQKQVEAITSDSYLMDYFDRFYDQPTDSK